MSRARGRAFSGTRDPLLVAVAGQSSAVDLKNRKIRVTEQLVQLEDRSFLRKEPKTAAGVRSITISPFAASLLAAHLEPFAQRVQMPWCSPTPRAIR